MRDLTVGVRWDDGMCVVALDGEARLETIAHFDHVAEQIMQRGVNKVILDMRGLSFMDSASTGSLLRLSNMVSESGGKLVLFGLQRMIARLLERLGLHQLPVYEDEAAALAALA